MITPKVLMTKENLNNGWGIWEYKFEDNRMIIMERPFELQTKEYQEELLKHFTERLLSVTFDPNGN